MVRTTFLFSKRFFSWYPKQQNLLKHNHHTSANLLPLYEFVHKDLQPLQLYPHPFRKNQRLGRNPIWQNYQLHSCTQYICFTFVPNSMPEHSSTSKHIPQQISQELFGQRSTLEEGQVLETRHLKNEVAVSSTFVSKSYPTSFTDNSDML